MMQDRDIEQQHHAERLDALVQTVNELHAVVHSGAVPEGTVDLAAVLERVAALEANGTSNLALAGRLARAEQAVGKLRADHDTHAHPLLVPHHTHDPHEHEQYAAREHGHADVARELVLVQELVLRQEMQLTALRDEIGSLRFVVNQAAVGLEDMRGRLGAAERTTATLVQDLGADLHALRDLFAGMGDRLALFDTALAEHSHEPTIHPRVAVRLDELDSALANTVIALAEDGNALDAVRAQLANLPDRVQAVEALAHALDTREHEHPEYENPSEMPEHHHSPEELPAGPTVAHVHDLAVVQAQPNGRKVLACQAKGCTFRLATRGL